MTTLYRIPDLTEALAKVDAALKPSDDDIAKGRELGAPYRFPEASVAIAIWAAARDGVAKQYAADHIAEIAERQAKLMGIDPDDVDYQRSAESIWALPGDIAMRLAETVQEGGFGQHLWKPVMKDDDQPAYHSFG